MDKPEALPVKGKKKRSFFEDDDFFVMKKKKAKSPKPVALPTKPTSQTKDIHNPPSSSGSLGSAGSGGSFDSDDLHQSFHSAQEAFSPPEVPLLVGLEPPIEDKPVEVISELDDDNKDDPDSELSKFFRGISGSGKSPPAPEDSSRVYTVKLISKVYDFEYVCDISGDVTFGTVLQTAKSRFSYYVTDQSVLMWVEGRSELKPFFKPSTLRISPSPYGAPTQVTVLHIFREQILDIDSLYQQYGTQSGEEDKEDDIQNELVLEVEEIAESSPPAAAKPGEDYFVIGLKGKDNKRIECEVGPQTKIRDLLSFYLKAKGIDEASVRNGRLVFDDEALDLNGLVGDTELEEDFEVQVYV